MSHNIVASASLDLRVGVAQFNKDLTEAARSLDRNFDKMRRAGDQLKQALGAITGGIVLRQVVQMTDEYNVLQSRIKSATAATKDHVAVSNQLYKIAQQTGTALRDNVEVFQRLSLAAGQLGASNKDILTLTDSVQKLGVIGGASSTALKAGLLQFGQAMGAGVVRAEEMNSILENLPMVADRIAKGMGKTTGELRQAVLKGKVLSSEVFQSLLKQAPQIAAEAAKIPDSVERSMQRVETAFSRAFSEIDQKIGITKGLSTALNLVAENATFAVNAVAGLAVGAGIMSTLRINAGAASVAFLALSRTLLTTPVGWVAAIAAGTAALIAFKDQAFSLGNQQVTISNLVIASWNKLTAGLKKPFEALRLAISSVEVAFTHMTAHAAAQFQKILMLANIVAKAYSTLAVSDYAKKVFGNLGETGIGQIIKGLGEAGKAIQEIIADAAKLTKGVADGGQVSEVALGKHAAAVEGVAGKYEDAQKKMLDYFSALEEQLRDLENRNRLGERQAEIEREILALRKSFIGPQEEKSLKRVEDLVNKKYEELGVERLIAAEKAQQGDLKVGGYNLKGMEAEARLQEVINGLQEAGIPISENLRARLDALKVGYQQIVDQDTLRKLQDINKDLDEQVQKAADIAMYGREEADVRSKLRDIAEELKITDLAQLDAQKKTLEYLKEQQKIYEFNNKLKSDAEANELARIGLIQDNGERNRLREQTEAIFQLGRALTEVEKTQVNAIAAQKTWLEDSKRAAEIIKESRTESEKYRDTLADLDRLYKQGQISVTQYSQAAKAASPAFKQLQQVGKEVGSTLTNAFDQLIFQGKSFKDTLKDLGKELARIAAKKAIFEPLERAIGKFFEKLYNPKVPTGPITPNSPFGLPVYANGPLKAPAIPGVTPPFTTPLANNPIGGIKGAATPTGPISVAAPTVNINTPVTIPSAQIKATGQTNSGGPTYSQGPVIIEGGNITINNPKSATINSSGAIPSGGLANTPGYSSGWRGLTGGALGGYVDGVRMTGGSIWGGIGGLIGGGLRGLIPGFADGGSALGGRIALVGERGPELIVPNSNSTVISNEQLMGMMGVGGDTSRWQGDGISRIDNAMDFLDFRAWTQSFRGQPLFQTMPFTPNLSLLLGNLQQALSVGELTEAIGKWSNRGTPAPVSTMAYNASAYNSMDWQKLAFVLNNIPDGIEGQMRQWMTDRDRAVDGFASKEQQKGNPLAGITGYVGFAGRMDRGQGRVKLPAGDQMGRMLMAWAHRVPMEKYRTLIEYANTRDWLMNMLEPAGGWTDTGPIGFGSKEGMGGVGSGQFFSGVTTSSVDPTGGDTSGLLWNGQGRTTLDPRTRMPTGLTIHTPTGGMAGGMQINVPGAGLKSGAGDHAAVANIKFAPGIKLYHGGSGGGGVGPAEVSAPNANPNWLKKFQDDYTKSHQKLDAGQGIPFSKPGESTWHSSQMNPNEGKGGQVVYLNQIANGMDTWQGDIFSSDFKTPDKMKVSHTPKLQGSAASASMADGFLQGVFDSSNVTVDPTTTKKFAMGGRPSPHVPALVGERGPELWIPDTAGKIIPNHKLGNGGKPNVTVVNNTKTEIEEPDVQMSSNGRDWEIVLEEKMVAIANRRNGKFARALAGRVRSQLYA